MATRADRSEVAVVVAATITGRHDVVYLASETTIEVALIPIAHEDPASYDWPIRRQRMAAPTRHAVSPFGYFA